MPEALNGFLLLGWTTFFIAWLSALMLGFHGQPRA
jgi:hypothetical protein